MPYQWTNVDPVSAFHPRLEPVSAWLFRRNSPFLRASDADSSEATLYAMPLDGGGFQQDVPDAWRALGVPNRGGPGGVDFVPFTNPAIAQLLRDKRHNLPDPKVFVLPLVAGSALSAEELLERKQLGTPRSTRPTHPLPEPPQAIVGIIDHGINIFHHRFRHRAQGSRVAYAWMQGLPRGEGRLPFGREFLQSDIETALEEDGADEDRLLRRIGADFARPGPHTLGAQATHGTHVLDLAAGFEPDDTAGDRLPIIAVSMPPAVSRETSGSMLALPFALGLEYIADRARHVMFHTGTVVPVFVNFSFGLTGGPRAGQHRLEQTIDRIAERHRAEVERVLGTADAQFTVVLAAGNNNLSRGHARAAPDASSLEIGWQLQPADPSANFLEIRCAPTEPTQFARVSLTVELTPPHSDVVLPATVDILAGRVVDNIRLLERDGAVIGRLSVWRGQAGIGNVTLALDATDPGADPRIVAPAGEWRVRVSYASAVPHQLDAWVLRDDVPAGFRDAGRQSYLVDPNYLVHTENGHVVTEDIEPDARVHRAGSLNAMATSTGGNRMTVGGYVGSSGEPTSYSAAPMCGSGERIDVSAISDRSIVRAGLRAAGTRSGSRVTINGTSVAAPQVVRHLASGAGTMRVSEGEPHRRMGVIILE